jgi:hypothetical protein
VPFRAGRLDAEKSQLILDSKMVPEEGNSRSIVNTSNSSCPTTTTTTPTFTSILTSRTTARSTCDTAANDDEGHVLIPYSKLKKWIADISMSCRTCV